VSLAVNLCINCSFLHLYLQFYYISARERPSALSHYAQSQYIVGMTARLEFDITLKTTKQNRIVCTSKSEAEVTNNKKTALEYYWRNEANYWLTQSIAWSLRQRSFLFFIPRNSNAYHRLFENWDLEWYSCSDINNNDELILRVPTSVELSWVHPVFLDDILSDIIGMTSKVKCR